MKIKTVMVDGSECAVETLNEWIHSRLKQIVGFKSRMANEFTENEKGRLMELGIILEKITDGRIQEIGQMKKETCEICGGDGVVSLGLPSQHCCPICEGSGKIFIHEKETESR